jgi:ElaB/YqjD/DUF883 family membrane-anchored ribosome-binding protein
MPRKATTRSPAPTRATPSVAPVGDAVRDEALKLGDVARQWLHQTGDQARHAARQMRRDAQVLRVRTQRYVRQQPVKSTLVAAAAGAALAGLVALALDRR